MGSTFVCAWGQGGGGRGAAAQQAGTAGRGGGRGGAVEFYNYDAAAATVTPIADAAPSETRQKIAIGGETVSYTARAGYLALRNPTSGQSTAHVNYTFYAKDAAGDVPARPVVMFLGGAPGVSAAWQEFGGLGPKRMKWASDGTAGFPPFGWVDNPFTLLSHADLVFANPIGTGYSRADQPGRGPEFWTTSADIASMGEFVRVFLNTYERRNSALFLAGEDFGATRVSGLAAYLIERQVPVQGVILLSMSPSADAIAGDEQYITLMPSLALAAWHHKKLAPELQAMSAEQIAEQARQFAARDFLHALYQGERLSAAERTKVVADLARLTGLSKSFIANNDMRITLERFSPELLREQRRAPSPSDARVAGFIPAPTGGRGGGRGGMAALSAPTDYNLSNLAGGFLSAYEAYLKRELVFNAGGAIYYLLSGGVGNYAAAGSSDASMAAAFERNPRLRLFVAINYFDLGAPFYAAEFTLAHLNVSREIRTRNITVSHFESGRMTYVDGKALAKLHGDLVRFISEAPAR